jgi:hypothetical protein
VRRRLTSAAATSLAAALLALAQPVAGPAFAADTPGAPPPSAGPTGGPAAEEPAGPAEAPTVDRIVTDTRITEASGLVASTRHTGVVWVHEDSGRPARLYAINRNGATAATVDLRGIQQVDWEAIAITKDQRGRWMLALGDIGDNTAARQEVRVLLLREPSTLKNGRASVQRVLRLQYPGGPVDAETLVADPRTRRLYIVTKGWLGGEIYAVPQQAWPGGSDAAAESRTWPLQLVARVGLAAVTDGTFLPDGRLALRSYSSMTLFEDPAKATDTLRPLATTVLPSQQQGESVALGPGATSLLIGSEGVRQPLLRVSLPTGPVSPEASDAATPTAVSAARTSAGDDRGGGIPSFLVLVVVAGIVLLLLIFGAVLIALR